MALLPLTISRLVAEAAECEKIQGFLCNSAVLWLSRTCSICSTIFVTPLLHHRTTVSASSTMSNVLQRRSYWKVY